MVAVISGADNGSLFMPSGVLTFSRPFIKFRFCFDNMACFYYTVFLQFSPHKFYEQYTEK
jgi:hypothetical protein